MTKFQKVLTAIKLLLKKPSLINLIVNSEERWDL